MADKTLTELLAASTPLDGSELFYGSKGGNSRKFTTELTRGLAAGQLALLATGDILYVNANKELVRLPKGLAGQVLAQNAGLTAPEWIWPLPKLWRHERTASASTTSTSYLDTGLLITLQASRADSAFWIVGDLNGIGGGAATNTAQFRLVRDSTVVSPIGDVAGAQVRTSTELPSNNAAGGATTAHTQVTAVDVPGDTLSHTYKVQWRTSGGTAFLNRSSNDNNADTYSRTASSLTILEVKKQ